MIAVARQLDLNACFFAIVRAILLAFGNHAIARSVRALLEL
jgi:hypothetical protein